MRTFLLLLIASPALAAPCGPHVFTAADQVKLGTDSALIVTHPSTQWDGRFASKLGMDATVKYAKGHKMPIVYLTDANSGNGNDTYFFSDCNPTYWFHSSGGEFSFDVQARHVYSVGGHWELCQSTTMDDLMSKWSKLPPGDLVLTEVMDGIYSVPEKTIYPSDPYYNDYQTFMKIIMYGRPDAWPFPKINLLEAMGMIKDNIDLQVEYLERGLPPYGRLGKAYTVELWLNDVKMKTLQKGQGSKPPRLKIEFVNTLYDDSPWIPGKN
jgi:hypothetical protein